LLTDVRIRLRMLLGEVHALNQHTTIIKNLQDSAVPAFVLASSYDDFVAFSNLVHIIRGISRSYILSIGFLQNLGCQRNNLHKLAGTQFTRDRAKNTSTNRLKACIQQYCCIAIKTNQ